MDFPGGSDGKRLPAMWEIWEKEKNSTSKNLGQLRKV